MAPFPAAWQNFIEDVEAYLSQRRKPVFFESPLCAHGEQLLNTEH